MIKKIVLFFVKTILPIFLGIYLFWFFFDNMKEDEIDLFFQRYDRDHDGRLTYREFCDIFVPLDITHAQILNSRQP